MKPLLLRLLLALVLALTQRSAPAHDAIGFVPAPVLPGGFVVPLFAPDSPSLRHDRIGEREQYNTTHTVPSARVQSVIGIHNPSIEVHLSGASTGAAVIVAPGGGHRILWVGPEGADLVSFFAQHGVATVILRNRLRVDGYEPTVDAVNDALQAVRIVRARAKEWKLDPEKIGIMGFSAGAELAAWAAIDYNRAVPANDPLAAVSARPSFVTLVYPGPSPFAKGATPSIPDDVPPSFITSPGSGDQVHALWATEYFTAMLTRGVPNLEMHIYGNGVHAGGIKDRGGIPFGTWHYRFVEWFRDLGFLQAPSLPTKAATDVAAYAAKRAANPAGTAKP